MEEKLVDLLSARRGHFLLESGHHGNLWLDLDSLFLRPAALLPVARELARREGVEIRTYDVIYKALEEIEAAMRGMLAPDIEERESGTAEVRQTFRVPNVGVVAGCYVTSGEIFRNNRVRVVRDGAVVYEGNIASLKRFRDDIRSVREGFECGVGVENFNDVKEGDVLEFFETVEVPR